MPRSPTRWPGSRNPRSCANAVATGSAADFTLATLNQTPPGGVKFLGWNNAPVAFTNGVGAVAESQNHHPDLHLAWGRVTVEIWTHKIDGLHESDFIFAAKCDRLYAG